jgi:hypothetical protein
MPPLERPKTTKIVRGSQGAKAKGLGVLLDSNGGASIVAAVAVVATIVAVSSMLWSRKTRKGAGESH